MKRESYSLSLLLAATGLFSSLFLSAQQYRDAAAFGLKGNVKECKVISLKSGNSVEDPHLFSLVSFTREGRLSVWTSKSNDPKYDEFFDPVHSDGLLTSIKCKGVTKTVTEYRFRYHDGILKGFYTLEDGGYDYFFGELRFTDVNHYWTQGKSDYFIYQKFHYKTIGDELNSYIEEEFKKGEDVTFSLEGYEGGKVTHLSECTIREKDSHGNYVLFGMYNIGGSVTTIKRIITYWDDEPASDEPTSAKPVQASSYSITSTAPGIKLSTSKELTLKDLISKPLGVIENPSKSLWGIDPEIVIEYIQGNKEWKCTESYGTYSIREGFNRTFKGYPLDVDVKKYEYVNYSYGYGYYVTMGYKDQETKEAASREMEKLFNIVVKEFRDLGIELTQSQGESWVRAEKTIGDMHYLVALNKPVEIDGKVFNEDYYVSICINKPL
ncbi:MAG: hypothetical protein J5907_05190 [Bacteroidales bacterium]|nr:hypothetical protein [Bacteroidales bacterium]